MLATCAPKAGDRTTTPVSMPGSLTSMPKMASAVTFSGVSSRFTGRPMILKSFGSLSFTSAGTGMPHGLRRQLAIAQARAVRGDHHAVFGAQGRRIHAPLRAAAATSMARAVAPALRRCSQLERTEKEPPVIMMGMPGRL